MHAGVTLYDAFVSSAAALSYLNKNCITEYVLEDLKLFVLAYLRQYSALFRAQNLKTKLSSGLNSKNKSFFPDKSLGVLGLCLRFLLHHLSRIFRGKCN